MTDVPSHSWVLPTLLNHAGIKFLQLGCNPASQYPRFPELFWWEGADGSRILCNYTALYGSDIKPTKGWPSKNYLAMQMTGDNHGPPSEKEIDKLLVYAKKEMPGVKIHFGTLDDFAKAVLAENPSCQLLKVIHLILGFTDCFQNLRKQKSHEISVHWNQYLMD